MEKDKYDTQLGSSSNWTKSNFINDYCRTKWEVKYKLNWSAKYTFQSYQYEGTDIHRVESRFLLCYAINCQKLME